MADALLQQMVRKQPWCDCTIFTIAHRLATVIDYDKIAVLDTGKLVEVSRSTCTHTIPIRPFQQRPDMLLVFFSSVRRTSGVTAGPARPSFRAG